MGKRRSTGASGAASIQPHVGHALICSVFLATPLLGCTPETTVSPTSGPSSASASSSGSGGASGSGGGGKPDVCQITSHVTLPASPLTTSADLQIQRAGEGFLLTTPTAPSDAIVAWARSSKTGSLGPTQGTTGGISFGLVAVARINPADQLIGLLRGSVTPGGGEQALAAVVEESTSALGPTHVVLDASYWGQVIQTRMASSLDGRRGIFVDANRLATDPQVVVLGGDGARQGTPITVTTTATHDWACLTVIPTATAGAVSTLEVRNGKLFWHVVELDASGAQVFEGATKLGDAPADGTNIACRPVVATPYGFAVGLFASHVADNNTDAILEMRREDFAAQGPHAISAPGDSSGEVPRGIMSLEFNPSWGLRAFATITDSDGFLHVRLFDDTSHAGPTVAPIPRPFYVAPQAIPSAPGTVLLATREADGRWGWLEVTCSSNW
jgi:hypothetical protein